MSIYGIRCFTRRPPVPSDQNSTEKVVPESQNWQVCTFLHNGGGVVSVGEAQSVAPADGGAGCQLVTTVPQTIIVPPGKALYWSSTLAAQNVSVTITEVPEIAVAIMRRG